MTEEVGHYQWERNTHKMLCAASNRQHAGLSFCCVEFAHSVISPSREHFPNYYKHQDNAYVQNDNEKLI